MNGIKLGFDLRDYAARTGRGIGKLCMNDGSKIRILGNEKGVDFFRMKHGELLGAKGFRGENGIIQGAMYLTELRKYAEVPQYADKAWTNAFNVMG